MNEGEFVVGLGWLVWLLVVDNNDFMVVGILCGWLK